MAVRCICACGTLTAHPDLYVVLSGDCQISGKVSELSGCEAVNISMETQKENAHLKHTAFYS